MFTPPPSPQPSISKQLSLPSTDTSSSTLSPPSFPNAMSSHDQKRKTGRRFKWAVLIVPAVLVLITASTHYLTHPVVFDIFSSPSRDISRVFTNGRDWRLHKRHPLPQSNSPPSSSLLFSGPATSSAPSPTVNAQPIPTIPGPPPTLPTPFPQPYDPQLTLNFSSVTCLTFFTNMTQSAAFRTCRPFSLLSQTSAAFINAQSNLTLMNTLIWGTCNTNTGINQCEANMGWFSENLKTACSDDLKDRNTLAVETLTALNAYKVMYDAACSSDPISNAYCYINAAANTSPADLYLYQLPLGISLPKTATGLSCSPCSKSVLNIYSTALSDKSSADDLTGLKTTYEPSAKMVDAACGGNFATLGVVSGALAVRLSFSSSYGLMSIFVMVLGIWTLGI